MTSDFLDRLQGLRVDGTYVVSVEESRPELVAYEIFGRTEYWWLILFYNGRKLFDDINIGDQISYPSTQDLEDLLFEVGSLAR